MRCQVQSPSDSAHGVVTVMGWAAGGERQLGGLRRAGAAVAPASLLNRPREIHNVVIRELYRCSLTVVAPEHRFPAAAPVRLVQDGIDVL